MRGNLIIYKGNNLTKDLNIKSLQLDKEYKRLVHAN